MIKITGIILITLIFSVLLGRIYGELYVFIPLCSALLIGYILLDDISALYGKIISISNDIAYIEPYIKLVIKVMLISLLAQFTGSVCNDCGQSALAMQTQIASKVIIIALALPLFETLLSIITGILK
jgi:stage III sporulation protein AD